MVKQKYIYIKKNLQNILLTATIFLAASGIGYLFQYIGFPDTNIVVIYLLAVLITSWLTQSFVFGFIASILATFLFNYFFAEPIFTFSVNDPNYIITFITMTITALITSILTSHVQRSAQQRIKSREEVDKERYRANLLRAISHDIRTPLSGMMGTTEMLIDMTGKGDTRYELIRGLQKDIDWLHSLVENILNLTRLQDGKLTVIKQREAVEEVISGAVSHIEAHALGHEITVNMPDELILVPMDAKLIEQAIINLLDNAIKHTEPEQEIQIVIEPCKNTNTVKFIIKDRGAGIQKTDLPNIFQEFYTSNTGNTDVKQGMGLGLAICETIVKAHGGSIEANNRTDGQGAEFSFTLPMED